MKQSLKQVGRIFLALFLAAIVFGALNWRYFWQNISYMIHKPQQAAQVDVAEKGEPNKLTIASIGVDAPVVYVNTKSETAFQEGLKSGVVHYPQTALPGQPGNVYIFGHSSDYSWSKGQYKTIFALLPRVAIGDIITITDA